MNKQIQSIHTPGPWHIQAKAGRHYIQADNGIQVACMVRQAERAEIANNADLLAAAPDLLAALQSIADQVNTWGFSAYEAGEIARAALAKVQS